MYVNVLGVLIEDIIDFYLIGRERGWFVGVTDFCRHKVLPPYDHARRGG